MLNVSHLMSDFKARSHLMSDFKACSRLRFLRFVHA